ncbi:hypothetical protein F5888DRAFT_1738119 [Russula emetica]|nr:hypothetical protein F5888DRAFT_1738119 [Russula emetica]
MVWRDRGEPAIEVHGLWECLEHAFVGVFELAPLPSRFVLALISSFSWNAVSSVLVLATSLG